MFYICSHVIGKPRCERNSPASRQNSEPPDAWGAPMTYLATMNLRCLLGRHRPMLTSIIPRDRGFVALCDGCGAPIERDEGGRWAHSQALVSKRDAAT